MQRIANPCTPVRFRHRPPLNKKTANASLRFFYACNLAINYVFGVLRLKSPFARQSELTHEPRSLNRVDSIEEH